MSGAGTGGRTGRRRSRRVDAPATRPGTDAWDEPPDPGRGQATASERADVREARDQWIVAQRPPHWD